MVFANSDFASAVSPFQNPVPPVLVDPSLAGDVSVCFNRAWIPYITGALQCLVLQATWDTDNPDTLQQVQNFAQQLISMFAAPDPCPIPGQATTGASEELMIRQDPTNPCLLQSSVDGVNWCTFADLSKCLGTPNQTGSESIQPRPGGGSQCYNTELQANSGYWIPTPVSTGDVIDISFSDGLWGDPASPLPRCPDGDIFIGQGCVTGTQFTHTGDPMSAKPHMSIIVDIGGTLFAQVDGPITVPSGASNVMARVFANTDVPNDASGSATIRVCVTNNQTSSWSSVLDFTTQSFSSHISIVVGVWSAGVGWTGTPSGSSVSYLQLDLLLGSCTLTLSEITYDCGPVTATNAVEQLTDGSLWGTPGTPINGSNEIYSTSGTRVVTNILTPLLDAGNSGSSSTTITKMRLTGTGTKPSWLP